jgi:hypothetical protein
MFFLAYSGRGRLSWLSTKHLSTTTTGFTTEQNVVHESAASHFNATFKELFNDRYPERWISRSGPMPDPKATEFLYIYVILKVM